MTPLIGAVWVEWLGPLAAGALGFAGAAAGALAWSYYQRPRGEEERIGRREELGEIKIGVDALHRRVEEVGERVIAAAKAEPPIDPKALAAAVQEIELLVALSPAKLAPGSRGKLERALRRMGWEPDAAKAARDVEIPVAGEPLTLAGWSGPDNRSLAPVRLRPSLDAAKLRQWLADSAAPGQPRPAWPEDANLSTASAAALVLGAISAIDAELARRAQGACDEALLARVAQRARAVEAFPGLWQPCDAPPLRLVFWHGESRDISCPGGTLTPLGCRVPPLEVMLRPSPPFQDWAATVSDAIQAMGLSQADLESISVLLASLELSWRQSLLDSPATGEAIRAHLVRLWAGAVTDLRARTLRHKIDRGALTPGMVRAWDATLAAIDAALRARGQRLATPEEAQATARVAKPPPALAWEVPVLDAGDQAPAPHGPFWLRPPILRADADPCEASGAGGGELVVPRPVQSLWRSPAMRFAWALADRIDDEQRATLDRVMLASDQIDAHRERLGPALPGPDLQRLVAEEYWEPLYELADAALADAPAARADFLQQVGGALRTVQLTLGDALAAPPDQVREAQAHDRVRMRPVLLGADGRVCCQGLRPARSNAALSGAN